MFCYTGVQEWYRELLSVAIHPRWISSCSVRALELLIYDELLHVFLRSYSNVLLVFASSMISDPESFPSNCGFFAFLYPPTHVPPIGFSVFLLLFQSLISTLSHSSLLFPLSSYSCGRPIGAYMFL